MEPVTTSVMIGTVVGYLAKKLKDNKSIQDFFSDFTGATVNWLRPAFLQDDKPKEIIQDLQEDPNDKLNSDAVENAIAKLLRKEPALEEQLKVLHEELLAKAGGNVVNTNTATVTGNNNKVYQGLTNTTINDYSVTQNHSGTGDNVGRDKIDN